MANNWYLAFGTGNPAVNTGLSPTFIQFNLDGLTAIPAPGITETPAASGFYRFQYTPTLSVNFLADGGAALSDADRYVKGALDPSMVLSNEIGTLADSIGSTAVDPTTLLGFAKRNQEFEEGNATFDKSTGIWDVYSRGSTTLLAEKTLTNTTAQATKS